MRIVFSGGGTLGPVTPLLAMHEQIKKAHPKADFVWVGTKRGPERELVEQAGIRFVSMPSGKLRRYISLWNITDLFFIGLGFLKSLGFMIREQPDLCISAGGYVSVPLHWAGWLFGVPSWVHQQDVHVTLSNKLMAPVAKTITTALESSLSNFSKRKTAWLGNPVRNSVLSGTKTSARKRFGLNTKLPVVFATGGGTGSMRVNQLVVEASQHLRNIAQVIHLSGKERPHELTEHAAKQFDWYHHFQFFSEEMADAYAVADVVISRGGFGTLTELAALGKAAILIPKPGHQEENVALLADAGGAMLMKEGLSDGIKLAHEVKELLADTEKQKQLGSQLQKVLPLAKAEDVVAIVDSLTA